jgi:ABC-type glycerol-3-phosphate transport system substrate-binding protein
MTRDVIDDGSHTSVPFSRRKALKSLGAVGSVGLAGCQGNSNGNDGNGNGEGGGTTGSTGDQSDISGQEVVFLKDQTGEELTQVINSAIQSFEEETGATVRVEYSGQDIGKFERLTSMIQSGNTPEIASINLSYGVQFKQQGLLEPVTSVMDSLQDKHGESVVRYQAEGEDWMVPFTQGASDYWYRDDLLEEAGLSADFVPDTWDKLLTFARAHDENISDDILQGGVFVQSSQAPFVGNLMMGAFHKTNNGKITEYTDGEFRVAFGSGEQRDRMIETLSFLQELHQYSVDAGGASASENEHSIQTGLGAGTYDGGARVKQHSGLSGEGGHHDSGAAYDSGKVVTNVGHVPYKRTKTSLASVGLFWVMKDGENTDAAKQFLEHMFSDPQTVADFCWGDGPVHAQPTFPGIKDSDYFQNLLRNDLAEHWEGGGRGGEYDNDNGIPATAERHLYGATSNVEPAVFETERPNPHIGAIWSSGILSEMVREVNINETDPETVVDNYAPQVQEILNDSQS